MSKTYFIGVDLGTTYLKIGIYDTAGELHAHNSQQLNLFNPAEGEYFQDPEEFYTKTLKGIKKCISESTIDPKKIKGIGFDGQSGGIMAVDHNFNAVIDYDIIIDRRAEKYTKLLNEVYKDPKKVCKSQLHGRDETLQESGFLLDLVIPRRFFPAGRDGFFRGLRLPVFGSAGSIDVTGPGNR